MENVYDGNSVYLYYPQQCNPQPAVVEVDFEEDTIDAYPDSEIGGGSPERVFNRRACLFQISADLTPEAVFDLIEHILPMAEDMAEYVSIEYDGNSNLVGKITEKGREIEHEIMAICFEWDGETIARWKPADFFAMAGGIDSVWGPGISIEKAAENATRELHMAEGQHAFITDPARWIAEELKSISIDNEDPRRDAAVGALTEYYGGEIKNA